MTCALTKKFIIMWATNFRCLILKVDSLITRNNVLYQSKVLINALHNNESLIKENSLNLDNCQTKLLKVAIIGTPNAGKSTLINNIMDRKVCPASNKVHTTRKRTHAIISENDTQIVFLDTPGIVSEKEMKKYNLEKTFMKDCTKSLHQADLIGVIHDISNAYTKEKLDIKIIRLLTQYKRKPSFLVLNKIDCLKSKRKLLDITRILTEGCLNSIPFTKNRIKSENNLRGWPDFSEIFMISAITGDGITDLKNYLISQAKPGDWIYPETQWTDCSPEEIIVKTVKATLLDFMPQEIPYKLKTKLELFETSESGKINAVVLVECPGERIQKLVVGVGDGKLRQITEKAQKDLLNTFDESVRLQIVVVNDKNKE